jgi:glutaminyl-tRNA synthetase
VKGTLHWVSARHAIPAEVRLYETLFEQEEPDAAAGEGFEESLNPSSLETIDRAWLEPCLAGLETGASLQLERLGYFCVDTESSEERLVLNRTATLRDSWAKLAKKGGEKAQKAGKR